MKIFFEATLVGGDMNGNTLKVKCTKSISGVQLSTDVVVLDAASYKELIEAAKSGNRENPAS